MFSLPVIIGLYLASQGIMLLYFALIKPWRLSTGGKAIYQWPAIMLSALCVIAALSLSFYEVHTAWFWAWAEVAFPLRNGGIAGLIRIFGWFRLYTPSVIGYFIARLMDRQGTSNTTRQLEVFGSWVGNVTLFCVYALIFCAPLFSLTKSIREPIESFSILRSLVIVLMGLGFLLGGFQIAIIVIERSIVQRKGGLVDQFPLWARWTVQPIGLIVAALLVTVGALISMGGQLFRLVLNAL